MIDRMVRPEEVLVSFDDHGNVIRDWVKDTDSQQQYKTMRETLVYLSHLDFNNTEEQMLEKLRTQLSGSLAWDKLNTLCWVRGFSKLFVAVEVQMQKRFGDHLWRL
jgi:exportin-1